MLMPDSGVFCDPVILHDRRFLTSEVSRPVPACISRLSSIGCAHNLGFPNACSPAKLAQMKLGIINSAFQQVGMDTATGLQHIARIGFDAVDIFTEAAGISQKEVDLVARTAERLALPIISLPVVALGLVDFNDPVREFHIQRCEKF